jgi:general secretion pathway protein J
MRRAAMKRAHARGLTLLEVMIAVAVLTLVSVLVYGAFSTIARGKQTAGQLSERYRVGRLAMTRMEHELSSAFISMHNAAIPSLNTRVTAFVGSSRRVDFDAFAHRRLQKDAHESDQCELGFFVTSHPKKTNQLDLVRREQTIIDDRPGKGGVVQVLADDIDTFQLKYLDPTSGLWTESWDTLSAAGQPNRLPLQVDIFLVLKGGPAGDPIRLHSKTTLHMLQPLAFALK